MLQNLALVVVEYKVGEFNIVREILSIRSLFDLIFHFMYFKLIIDYNAGELVYTKEIWATS